MRRLLTAAMAAVLAFSLPGVSGADEAVTIDVVSNRADLLSGGDALIEITVPDGRDPADLTIMAGDANVTSQFAVRQYGGFMGLVTGLPDGETVLSATFPDNTGAQITLANHAIGGPILSGPQVTPWLCTTNNNGLGQPLDEQCNAPTIYTFHYMPAGGGGFQAYDPNNPPTDVATTTTDQGETVPYIVRRERGTANRGIYDIAVLYNPDEPWAAWAPQPGWNGKLHYIFGASCGTIHSQSSPVNVLDAARLGRGFMVVNSSMNNLGNNCNTVTSAESAMMLKERVVEQYGPIRYTIGSGCSGGSIGQHMVSNAYPGLVDGIQPNCSYDDTWSTGVEVVDCHMLNNYFRNVAPHMFTPAQQGLLTGHATASSCAAWEALFVPVANPNGGCGLPPEQEYPNDPQGCRGSLADYMKSIVGTRESDGFANLAYDNVGVQYGLNALNSGLIVPEQFVDLNEKIGGLDIDFNHVANRREADPNSVRYLYQSGQVNDGGQLDQVAMIDLRGTSNLEIHTDFHSYSMRRRLLESNGHADNHAIWSSHVPLVGDPAWSTEAFLTLDRWLAAVEADTSDAPREVKIARNRPANAVDSCWFAGQQVTDMNACRPAFPYFAAPRIAAGGPVSHDVLKCQLKPLDEADYNVEFTADQWTRLQAAFPQGVCDWSKPGVDQVPSIPWMTFENGPGGQPLGPAPASTAL